ncbi:MAG: DNA repair protein RecO [Chloroflexi bacterium]|nr:DNA repair protein RecO [Chloroflexota bacterium]
MARPHVYRTEAIVLRRFDLGEADRILTLATPRYGKLRALAKGVRRPTSRLAGHLEPFVRSALLLAIGRELDLVTQAQTLDAHRRAREDLWWTAHAYCVVEVFDQLTAERQENEPLYDLLAQALQHVEQEADPFVAVRAFEVGALSASGYQPELHRCLGCQETLQPVVNALSPPAGGTLCPRCGARDETARPLTVNALKVLRLLQRGDYATARRLRLAPPLRREIESATAALIQHVAQRKLQAPGFLAHVRQTEALGASEALLPTSQPGAAHRQPPTAG